MLTFSRVWLTLETVLIFCKNIRLVLWIGFQAQTVFNTGLLSLWKTPRKVLMLFNFADLNGIDRELNMEHYMSARRYGISLRKFSSIAWMSRVTLASLRSEFVGSWIYRESIVSKEILLSLFTIMLLKQYGRKISNIHDYIFIIT